MSRHLYVYVQIDFKTEQYNRRILSYFITVLMKFQNVLYNV